MTETEDKFWLPWLLGGVIGCLFIIGMLLEAFGII